MDSSRFLKDLGEITGVIVAVIATFATVTFAAFQVGRVIVREAVTPPAAASSPNGDSSGVFGDPASPPSQGGG